MTSSPNGFGMPRMPAPNSQTDSFERPTPRPFIRKPELQGMRRFPVSGGFEKILLFYFPLQDGIDLARVVHGSRDLAQILAEGFFG